MSRQNPVSANELIRRLKSFFRREESRWNNVMKMNRREWEVVDYIVIEKRDADHIEVRTDALAYDMFYDPTMADYPSLMYPYHTRFYNFLEKLGWKAEPEGGGILTVFRD
jgi:hypothetical protein